MKTQSGSIALICLSLSFASGCTHLIDPYVTDKTLSAADCAANMSNALACVNDLQGEYLAAKSSQAELTAWTGLAMIPLAAYAGGVAINDGHRTNITDLSLGMAGLYGMSTWLAKPARSEIYGVGSESLQCAVDALSAFELVPQNAIEMQRTAVSADIAGLQAAANSLSEWLSNPETSAAETRALENRQVLADALISSATREVDDANILIRKTIQAPGQLLGAARRINNAINNALTGTISSLSTLPGTLNVVMDFHKGLSASYMAQIAPPKNVADGPEQLQSEADAEEVARKRRLDAGLAAFKTAFDKLKASSGTLDNSLAAYTPDPPTAGLETCGVDIEEMERPVTLDVASVEFSGAAGPPKTVVISGGDGQYNYTDNAEGVTVTFTPPSILTLRTTDTVEPGSYALAVQDFSGNRVSIPIIVSAAEAPAEDAATPEEENGAAEEECENPEGLPPDQLDCTEGE